jgi:hypothetical protein
LLIGSNLHPGNQPTGSRHAVALLDQVRDEAPIRVALQRDADPTVHTDVGRDEVTFRVGLDKRVLGARRCLTPHGPSALVPIVAHGEDLVAHAEGWIANPCAFGRFWQGEADGAQPLEHGLLVRHGVSLRGSGLRTSRPPLIELNRY